MSAAETAAANVQPPSPQEVGTLLGTLFGQRVEARSEARKPTLDRGVVATYGTADGVAHVLIHLDLALSASAAAALTRIPAAVADEAVRGGKLPDNLLENLQEVTNVLSRVPRTRWGQLRIQATTALPAKLAPPVAEALTRGKPLASFTLTVTGYRPGTMTVLEVGSEGQAAAARGGSGK